VTAVVEGDDAAVVARILKRAEQVVERRVRQDDGLPASRFIAGFERGSYSAQLVAQAAQVACAVLVVIRECQ
jgi:hypothetical protein